MNNVARTKAQLRQNMNFHITGTPPGLVALWHLAGNANDPVGGHHGGALQGGAAYDAFCHGCGGDDCVASPTLACFFSNRFAVSGEWTLYSPPAADGHVTPGASGPMGRVPGSSDSATNFWFFSPANWEVLAKGINGCTLNAHWWIFSAATTDVHYKLRVFDYETARLRIYFNFAGPPAPALTDTSALPCP